MLEAQIEDNYITKKEQIIIDEQQTKILVQLQKDVAKKKDAFAAKGEYREIMDHINKQMGCAADKEEFDKQQNDFERL